MRATCWNVAGLWSRECQLDYCKLYPCLDLPYTKTRLWKESGQWKPLAEYDFPAFLDLLRHAMASVPPWVRVNRVQVRPQFHPLWPPFHPLRPRSSLPPRRSDPAAVGSPPF